MANLQSIRTHYLTLPEPLRRQFVSDYRAKRTKDVMSTRQEKPPKEAKAKTTISLTEEEKQLMKMLGITVKQLKQMRSQV